MVIGSKKFGLSETSLDTEELTPIDYNINGSGGIESLSNEIRKFFSNTKITFKDEYLLYFNELKHQGNCIRLSNILGNLFESELRWFISIEEILFNDMFMGPDWRFNTSRSYTNRLLLFKYNESKMSVRSQVEFMYQNGFILHNQQWGL